MFSKSYPLTRRWLLLSNELMVLSGLLGSFLRPTNMNLSRRNMGGFPYSKAFSTRIGTSKENVKILCHKPNLVSRQFGIIQTEPKPFFNRKSELCICTIDYSKDEYLQRLSQHANDHDVLTTFAANAK